MKSQKVIPSFQIPPANDKALPRSPGERHGEPRSVVGKTAFGIVALKVYKLKLELHRPYFFRPSALR